MCEVLALTADAAMERLSEARAHDRVLRDLIAALASSDTQTLSRALDDLDVLDDHDQAILLLDVVRAGRRTPLTGSNIWDQLVLRDRARFRAARIVVRSPWAVRDDRIWLLIRADDLDRYERGYPEPRPLPEEERRRLDYLMLRLRDPELMPGLI